MREEKPISGEAIVVAVRDQISCDLVGEVILLNLNSGKQFLLDGVGAAIWRLIREPRSLDELQSSLLRQYDVDKEQCQSDLLEWIQRLLTEGLVEVKQESTGPR